MAEILIKGWECDACNREFFEGDGGYKDRSRVIIQSESKLNDHSEDLPHVCGNCIGRNFTPEEKKLYEQSILEMYKKTDEQLVI